MADIPTIAVSLSDVQRGRELGDRVAATCFRRFAIKPAGGLDPLGFNQAQGRGA